MNHKCYQLCLQVVPECSSVSYNLAFLAWGSSAFPWYGTGTFFFQSRSSLNTFSSPAWTAANPGAQSQSLSFVLSIPRTFWRKNPQKPAQTFCEGKGYNTCLSLTSHSTLLLTYKMLVVLKCRTGIIPTSRCFFCIRRECHCFRQTMSSCCKWILRTSVLPFWVHQNELVHIGSWTIHVFFFKECNSKQHSLEKTIHFYDLNLLVFCAVCFLYGKTRWRKFCLSTFIRCICLSGF